MPMRPRSSSPRVFALALLGVLVPALAHAQSPDPRLASLWTSHTSMRRVTALSAAGDTAVWVGTSGGVFRYRAGGGAITRFTVADGLYAADVRAIAYDARRDAVWIGYGDGVVDRLDARTGAVRTLRDVARAERFPQRSVNRLVVSGDSVFACTAFGLVVFDGVRLEVRDTYSRLGALPAGTAVYDVVRTTLPSGVRGVAVAAEGGVALGPLDGRNLQDPASWTVEVAGLPSASVRAVAVFDGRLHAGTTGTTGGVAVRTPSAWVRRGGGAVADFAAGPGALYAATPPSVAAFAAGNGGPAGLATGDALAAPSAVELAGGALYVGDAETGLVRLVVTGTEARVDARVVPPGPAGNLFRDLSFAPDGTLWAAGNDGLSRLNADGATWTNFTARTTPGILGIVNAAAATKDGGVWAGTPGAGALRIDADGTVQRYTRQNSTLRTAVSTNPDFLIVDGVGVTDDGMLWATNKSSAQPLHVRTPDGTWTALPLARADGYETTYRDLQKLFVDSFGAKWILVQDERDNRNGRGVLVLDTGTKPADPADDAFRFFNEEGADGQGLPRSTNVLAIDEDPSGRIWIGTAGGIAYLPNTGVVARDPTADFVWPVTDSVFADGKRRFLLLGLRTNAVAVDPAGGVWVGTDTEGALRVEEREGGFAVTNTFNTDDATTPILSDRVLDIAIHPRTGEVFFATDGGLVSWRGGAATPVAKAADLFVYPNPVRAAPGDAVAVTIRGLVAKTDVRILAPDGRLIARLEGRGGSVVWDGRDAERRPVGSGVYLVVAVGQGGEGAAYGKVAVIR